MEPKSINRLLYKKTIPFKQNGNLRFFDGITGLTVCLLFIVFILNINLAYGNTITDVASGVSGLWTTYDRISNKMLYAGIAVLLATLKAAESVGKGEKKRKWLSRALACLIYTGMVISMLFLVIYFSPEMGTFFDIVGDIIGRIK